MRIQPGADREPQYAAAHPTTWRCGDAVIGQSPFVGFEFRAAQHGSQLPTGRKANPPNAIQFPQTLTSSLLTTR